MENKSEIFSEYCHDISPYLAALEEIVKSKNVDEKRAAWRQQYLLLKSLNQKVADNFTMHNWMQHHAAADHAEECNKYLSILLNNEERYRNIDFPSIDINHSASLDMHNEMFKAEHCKINPRQSENTGSLLNKPMASNKESSSNKIRNTMGNFLHGPKSVETNPFSSARQLLAAQTLKKQLQEDCGANKCHFKANYSQKADVGFNFSATKKSLGRLGSSSRKNFISPKRIESSTSDELKQENEVSSEIASILSHPALKNVDSKMVELINNEIIHEFKPVDWNEIAGLHYAKSIIKEAVVYPLLRPDIFTGLRRPPRGILLFGPPGTGKTLIGKCIASQSSSTFFSISSATLTSKWMGDGEKMVRALFAVAAARQPSVIFIDEIDALLSQRSENENEGTRRLKTEFLVRLDGTSTSDDDRVLIVGATNRPQELDEAVRRRFVKRLYVPLPEADARAKILSNLLKTVENSLTATEIEEVSNLTEGYSGADMDSLCREASMEPLRLLTADTIITYPKENLRPVHMEDFYIALKKIRPSVSPNDLSQLVEWNKIYGSSN